MSEHYFPLHPAQQDVYMDQLLNIDSPQYNIGGYITLKGNLDKEKFNEAVNSATQVFDAFKMRFHLQEQDFLYYYDSDFNGRRLIGLDFSDDIDPVQGAKAWMQGQFNSPFLLNKETFPFEQFLIKISDQEHWFFGRYHHLITDGYGFIIYVQHIARNYNALLTGNKLQGRISSIPRRG